jgi:hypothetical protein
VNKAHRLIALLLDVLGVSVPGFGENDGSYDPIEALLRSIRFINGAPTGEGTELETQIVTEYRRLLADQIDRIRRELGMNECMLCEEYTTSYACHPEDPFVDLVAIMLSLLIVNGPDLLNDRVQFELFPKR